MFNGLIHEIAQVKSYAGTKLILRASHRPQLGDSIAVNGACLSVTRLLPGGFELELSAETRSQIATQNLTGQVHIEPALRFGQRIDGHLMQGHIDFLGRLERVQRQENGVDFFISLPPEAMKFMAHKGSVGLDGVSLTINEILKNAIRLTLIPLTLSQTLFGSYSPGRMINVESDLLARYLHAQTANLGEQKKGLTWEEVEKISFIY